MHTTHHAPHHVHHSHRPTAVPSESIFTSVIILAASLGAFVLILVGLRLRLGKFSGLFFIAAYLVFIVYQIMDVYSGVQSE